MKIFALLVSLMTVGSMAHAQDDQISFVKYCASKSVVVNIEVYQSGVVGWVVTDMTTGENQNFMGYISAGDSKDLQTEFYSTDLGSDLHVNGKAASLSLTRDGERNLRLKCD